MPTKTKASGRAACVAALRVSRKPLAATEVADAVLKSGVVPTLRGKTPAATLTAQITHGAKVGRDFKRVGNSRPARYTVRAAAEETPDDLLAALRPFVR